MEAARPVREYAPLGYQAVGAVAYSRSLVVVRLEPIICGVCGRRQPTRYIPPRCLNRSCPSNR